MKLKLDGYFWGLMLRHHLKKKKKKIRVALESRTLIWVPLLQAMTLNQKSTASHELMIVCWTQHA